MKDIVIPYKKNDSGELEACIALIKKNVPHRKIHVVTDFEQNRYSYIPHINQILKVKWAIEHEDLTDEFYLYNDDFFVLEPIEGTPYFYRDTLQEHYLSRHGGMYARALNHTLDFCDDGFSYEMHVPFLFDKQKFASLLEIIWPHLVVGKAPLMRSAYGNTYRVGGTMMEDVKNPKEYHGLTYLSTSESSFAGELGDYIRSKL